MKPGQVEDPVLAVQTVDLHARHAMLGAAYSADAFVDDFASSSFALTFHSEDGISSFKAALHQRDEGLFSGEPKAFVSRSQTPLGKKRMNCFDTEIFF